MLMKDLAHTHLTDQDFIKIQRPVLLGWGSEDNMVTNTDTEYTPRLIKNSEFKTYDNMVHPIEKVPVDLLANEIIRFF